MNSPLSRTIALTCASLGTLFALNTVGSAALAAPSSVSQPADQQAAAQPAMQYLIILDVSGSMSWNIDGEGTVSNIDYQCEWDSPRVLFYRDSCAGPNSFWRVENERRIYLAKQMVGNLIDVMQPQDQMRIVAFTTGATVDNTQVRPIDGWSSDHDALKADLLLIGSYKDKPYITDGGSAQVQGIAKARDVAATAPTTTPSGSSYRTVVIMIADGPANIFIDGTVNAARDICPNLTASQAQHTAACQVDYSDAYKMDRPVTQMISAAAQLKQATKVDFYTVNMTNKDNIGMVETASTTAKAYHYTTPDLLAKIAARYHLFIR